MGTNSFWKELIFTYICLVTVVFCQEVAPAKPKPIIKSLHIDSDVKYTYARTLVSSRILNPADTAQEVSFRVVLPEEAFISHFVMEIKGKSYEAYVKGKEDAKKDYDAAVSAGLGAAHVFQENTRNSKDFRVAVNVEGQDKVNFNLTYEELLSRKNRTYKNEINVNPNQIVKDLSITVTIEDVLNISKIEVPEFKMGNEVSSNEVENKDVKKTFLEPNKVKIEWTPTVEEQKRLNAEGLNGQLIVKYDVDSTNDPQQILVDNDGYFLHILRNDNLPIINKHVVFVLDVSGSMAGTKIDQLKDAMKKILSDLSENDRFSIILFSSKVVAWGPKEGGSLEELNSFNYETEPANVIPKEDYVIPATKTNVEEALKFISSLGIYSATNIMGGLRNGVKIAKLGQRLRNNSLVPEESMIIFLTDGQPNVEESSPDKITENIARENTGVTVFSLGFGFDADMNFLKKLSLGNSGFARRIYEDSDASLQLQNFYKEVASPVLSGVKFEYLPNQVENTTSDGFKNLFSGSDLVVLGKLKPQGSLSGALVANTQSGVTRFDIPISKIILLPPLPPIPDKNRTTGGRLEKVWAYKTIKTLLDKNTVSKNDTIENKAKDLALKYSFVTPLTSLVVIKPNESSLVDDEESGKIGGGGGFYPGSYGSGRNALHAIVKPAWANSAISSSSFGAGGFNAPMAGPLPPMSPPQFAVDSQDKEESTTYQTTTVSPHYIRVDISEVKWLNQTASDDGEFLQPPSSLNTTDVIALNETTTAPTRCLNGDFCRHFKECALMEFADDISKFIPLQCHIDPKFLGVCCPIDF